MDISLFDYAYPDELVAQHPLPERDQSRLMLVDPCREDWRHQKFCDIVDCFGPEDTLVFNDVKVFPARLYGYLKNGRSVEVLLLEQQADHSWTCMIRPASKVPSGSEIFFGENDIVMVGTVQGHSDQWNIRLKGVGAHGNTPLQDIIDERGLPPLPPYINRSEPYADKAVDTDRYQTIYAEKPGAAAAPTAGFHFTTTILERLRERGCQFAYVTLNVGQDTFQPVRAQNITDHHMHGETYHISEEAARLLNSARQEGRRITAVGTTTVRVLESAWAAHQAFIPGRYHTEAFFYPGYAFQIIDRLITNFHQPRSTLLMLVAAFAGREFMLQAYQEAIRERYRLFSFGDAMMILNQTT